MQKHKRHLFFLLILFVSVFKYKKKFETNYETKATCSFCFCFCDVAATLFTVGGKLILFFFFAFLLVFMDLFIIWLRVWEMHTQNSQLCHFIVMIWIYFKMNNLKPTVRSESFDVEAECGKFRFCFSSFHIGHERMR